MKLELGAGHRPTRGYDHNDLYPFDHIEHVGHPALLDLPDQSLFEVLALGFVEHLRLDEARDVFRNVRRMLTRGGVFLFDVPDYPVWASYYVTAMSGGDTPVGLDHIRKTLFGWQRWPGDEHLYGWDATLLRGVLKDCGFKAVLIDALPLFQDRVWRARFDRPEDAHLYVAAYR